MKRKTLNRNLLIQLTAMQKGLCGICGRPLTGSSVEIHHVKPLAKGGGNEFANLLAVHSACNRSIGANHVAPHENVENRWANDPFIQDYVNRGHQFNLIPQNGSEAERIKRVILCLLEEMPDMRLVEGISERQIPRLSSAAISDLLGYRTWFWNKDLCQLLIDTMNGLPEGVQPFPGVCSGMHFFEGGLDFQPDGQDDWYVPIAHIITPDGGASGFYLKRIPGSPTVIFEPGSIRLFKGPSIDRWMAAASAILRQRIAQSVEGVSRAERRRLRRWGYAPSFIDALEVREVRWRKVETASRSEESLVRKVGSWFRFWVTGHWRKQWFPRSQKHHPVFIHPHLKGADGMPIRYKPTVNVVDR